ncbi:leucine-, glutamate- and lysine-rich protein 1-like [Mizuhopecten yessoensis]|uniref:Leucine-, glutamate-and lysine-rich protein 1 n=1 Tax=Mizuhopecten yessoensis TaxID=6573 RepID=A0A210R528_MIZYE|nr:leucine-, glutamate- and lysine-rich protein 1-like [Mizuhopecten yessoensis]XP_021356524.1 leucine-, glutamate- and lysine-rich protein 1-like [Mizuhopecten yessoensis]OWF56036.1 Leucine-, glutamate- and lysine-rich protein 1 [Mizuhopecten yessoensis]
MKTKMSDGKPEDTKAEPGEFEHYHPQHPLPEGIRKMEHDDTICKYCGVSYLIHNEIKAMEAKLKKTIAEMEHYRGSMEREKQLRIDYDRLMGETKELRENSQNMENIISSLRSSLKNEEELSNHLRLQNQNTQGELNRTITERESYRLKFTLFEEKLPYIKTQLASQRQAMRDVHKFVEERDTNVQTELQLLQKNIIEKYQSEQKGMSSLLEQIEKLESEKSESSMQSTMMTEKVRRQEKELKSLSNVRDENSKLQQKCDSLETCIKDIRQQLDDAVSTTRQLNLQSQQFKDSLRNKAQEIEDITAQSRRKEQNTEMTLQKLQSDLKKKDTELMTLTKEMKSIESRFKEQKRKEEEIHRKATLTVTETRELKNILAKAEEEIEQLKGERESMIMSHQNRIEQLRESFKQKMFEAECWPEKLEEALQKERAKHVASLNAMEERLKENFILEIQIEKEKYQELLGKYQNSNKEHEAVLKAQLNSLESKYRSEIRDLQKFLSDTKERAKDSEDSLRKEVQSLKSIIQNLENRLGRLDIGNEEMISTLRQQLKETHQELEDTRQQVEDQAGQLKTAQEENAFLQETVRKECEERFELMEKFSEVKEELLHLKKPSGGYSSLNSSRNSSAANLKRSGSFNTRKPSPPEEGLSRRDSEGASPMKTKTPSAPSNKELGPSTNNELTFGGESAKVSGRLKGNSLAENRRRIAQILGRREK